MGHVDGFVYRLVLCFLGQRFCEPKVLLWLGYDSDLTSIGPFS